MTHALFSTMKLSDLDANGGAGVFANVSRDKLTQLIKDAGQRMVKRGFGLMETPGSQTADDFGIQVGLSFAFGYAFAGLME